MKQLVKKSAMTNVISVGETLTRLVSLKCIALFLGAAGAGLLAQFWLLFETLRIFGDFGSKEDVADKNVLKHIYVFVFLASGVAGFLTVVFSPYLSQAAFGIPDYYLFLVVIGLLLPFVSVSVLTNSILKENAAFLPFTKYISFSHLGVLVLTPVVIYFFRYWGAIFIYGCFLILPLIVYLVFNAKTKLIRFDRNINWDLLNKQFADRFLRMAPSFLFYLSHLIISAWVIDELGYSYLGIFVVVLVFSVVFMSIPRNSIFSDSYTAILAATTPRDTSRAINESIRFITLVSTPLIILVMLWPHLLISFFFSSEFRQASALLEVQFVGIFFFIMSYPIILALKDKAELKTLLVVNVLNPVLFVFFTWLFLDSWGLIGVTVAFVLTCKILSIVYYLYARNYFEMMIVPKNQKLLAAAVIWILLTLWACRSDLWIIRLIISLGIIPWFFFSSKSHERQLFWNKIKGFPFAKPFSI